MIFDFFSSRKSAFEKLYEAHIKLCEIKDEIDKINKRIDETASSSKTLEKKLNKLKEKLNLFGQKKFLLERVFVNDRRGLYLGIGVDLKELDGASPIFLSWPKLNNHMSIIGTTRYGKTRLLVSIVDQLIAKGDNVIFIDPKQGIGNDVGSYILESLHRHDRMDDIMVINTLHPSFSTLINPCFGLGDEELTSMLITAQHPTVASAQANSNELFYAGFAQIVLMGIFRGLSFLEKNSDPDGTQKMARTEKEFLEFIKIMEMKNKPLVSYDPVNKLMDPDVATRLFSTASNRSPSAAGLSVMYDRSFITFADIAFYTLWENLEKLYSTVVHEAVNPLGDINDLTSLKQEAIANLGTILSHGQQYYENVTGGFRSLLLSLSTGLIGRSLCTVRVNPLVSRLYQKERGLVALIQPCPMKFQRTSEYLVEIFMKTLYAAFGTISGTGRGFSRRLWIVIDEGEAILKPGIQSFANKVGGMGASLIIATQSFADFDYKLNPTLARVASDSINTVVMFKPNDPISQDRMIDMMGTKNTLKSTIMMERGGLGGRMSNRSEPVNLISKNNLIELQPGEMYVIHHGKRLKVIAPQVPDPSGELTMPIIEEEKVRAHLEEFEARIQLWLSQAKVDTGELDQNIALDQNSFFSSNKLQAKSETHSGDLPTLF